MILIYEATSMVHIIRPSEIKKYEKILSCVQFDPSDLMEEVEEESVSG